MALLQTGRQLPILRYLTSLASYQRSVAIATNPKCAGHYSSASGTGSSSAKEEPGKAVTENPVASTVAATSSGDAGSPPASTSQPATVDDDEWTEVVHSSGQLYYWNQRTGQTTQLGEPKPKSDRGSGGGSGDGAGSTSGSAGSAGARGGAAEGHSHDPRAEAPMEDRTGTYASMGVIIGAFLGWVSQFV